MRRIARPLVLITLVLLVPVVPFHCRRSVEAWALVVGSAAGAVDCGRATTAILASDIFLPVLLV